MFFFCLNVLTLIGSKYGLVNYIAINRTNACYCCNFVGLISNEYCISFRGEEFRKAFKRLGTEFMPLFDTPVLICTATAPPKKLDELIKVINLKDPHKVVTNPDRANISLEVIQRPPSKDTEEHLEELLKPICCGLKEDPSDYPVTIWYTDTATIAYCYAFTKNYLDKDQYVGNPVPENRIFAQYHSEYTPKMKKHIVSELCQTNSKIRLVFATVSLGMGLNAPAIRHVVHYKPPTSLERYFQELGRAGRDGQPSRATMYYNNSDTRSNRPGITRELIAYCKQNSTCRRRFILDYFGHQINEASARCCDICEEN